ncbi:MAG TPA: carboxymuconolactone decarboxylase family protein [Anaerovoracaceae bacterium]|nr:carboxymuconolactone decarboxylase family protein [Anaerovoracaceae bacterium]
MEKEKALEMIKKEMDEVPKPLGNLADLDMNILTGHLEAKRNAYSGEKLDRKTKALIALAVGIALDSQGCIMNNVKAAKKNGASTEEIMETYSVAKFSKSASCISGFAAAMDWLVNNQDAQND